MILLYPDIDKKIRRVAITEIAAKNLAKKDLELVPSQQR
jgi:hypothetical protein